MLDITNLTAFTAAMFVLAASPGPGVLAVTSRGAYGGFMPAFVMGAGMSFGDVIFLTFVVCGLSVIAKTAGLIFLIIKYLGAAYLIYTGLKMIFSKSDAKFEEAKVYSKKGSFFAGLFIALGNPKVMVFYLSFLPQFFDLTSINSIGLIQLIAITFLVLNIVLGTYAYLASRTGNFLKTGKGSVIFKKGTGALMTGAGVLTAIKR